MGDERQEMSEEMGDGKMYCCFLFVLKKKCLSFTRSMDQETEILVNDQGLVNE